MSRTRGPRTPADSALVEQRSRETGSGVAGDHGAQVEVDCSRESRPTAPHREEGSRVVAAATAAGGAERVDGGCVLIMANEDFGRSTEQVPGCTSVLGNDDVLGAGVASTTSWSRVPPVRTAPGIHGPADPSTSSAAPRWSSAVVAAARPAGAATRGRSPPVRRPHQARCAQERARAPRRAAPGAPARPAAHEREPGARGRRRDGGGLRTAGSLIDRHHGQHGRARPRLRGARPGVDRSAALLAAASGAGVGEVLAPMAEEAQP